MINYVLPTGAVPSVEVAGTAMHFPVRRIFCVGRNYAEHAREMGNDDREPPFFFMKPADALVADKAHIPYPPATKDLHHEAELVVAIGIGGLNIPAHAALRHVWGYAAGNDLTRRDLQAEAKAARRPWDMGKGFDRSAVVGELRPVTEIGHPSAGAITCRIGHEIRQQGDLSEMTWPVPDIIAHLSRLVDLAPGDLIMTGTPAGVGPILAGETCTVEVEGVGRVDVTVG